MASFNVSQVSELNRFLSPQLQATQTTSRFAGLFGSQVSSGDLISKLPPGIFGIGGPATGAGSAGASTGGSGSGGTGTSTVSSGTVSSGAGAGPGEIAMLVGDIPIANDGDVITADYHNTLREAIQAIAAYMGTGAGAHASIETLAPTLQDASAGSDTPWAMSPQAAVASGLLFGLGSRDGWLPVDLPDGVNLQSLSVVDQRAANLGSLVVTLGRYSLTDPTADPITLATVSEGPGNNTVTTDSAVISVAGISDPTVVAGLARVDNSAYRYFIRASAAWSGFLRLEDATAAPQAAGPEATPEIAGGAFSGLALQRLQNPAVASFANTIEPSELESLVHATGAVSSASVAGAAAAAAADSQTTLVHDTVPASPPEGDVLAKDASFFNITFASLYAFQIAYTLW